ncbi:MAG: F0F1 ATP synthase subunit delta [Thermodesulfobacteriota bacterium]
MSIDLFTAAAQIINLFILIWLLKKFLYGPVLRTMHKRQEQITEKLQEAAKEKAAAEEEKKHYKALQEKAGQEAREKLREAGREADDLRQRLMKEARDEEEKARRKWHRELENEKEQFLIRTSRTVAEEFGRLSRNAFSALADQDFEREMVKRFLEKTGREPDIKVLKSLKDKDKDDIRVVSSRELSPALQQQIREHLKKMCGRRLGLHFETDPDLLAGIVVEVEGRKVGWHLSRYLDDFQKRLKENLEQSGNRSQE